MIDSVSDAAGAAADLKKARRRKNVSAPDPIKTDRLPPHSIECEQGVLGCVLLSPNDCMSECIARFKTKVLKKTLDKQRVICKIFISNLRNHPRQYRY